MISIEIPGFGAVTIKHLVLDYNGTLAVDGKLIQQTVPILHELGKEITSMSLPPARTSRRLSKPRPLRWF